MLCELRVPGPWLARCPGDLPELRAGVSTSRPGLITGTSTHWKLPEIVLAVVRTGPLVVNVEGPGVGLRGQLTRSERRTSARSPATSRARMSTL